MVKEYVLSFAFTEDRSKVLLILKDRPSWQAGNLNGIGGKVEVSDKGALHALVREFKEETGLSTQYDDWNYFARMDFENDVMGGKAVVYCFSLFSDIVYMAKTIETEKVMLISLDGPETIELPMMVNVPMLIEMALNRELDFCTVNYK